RCMSGPSKPLERRRAIEDSSPPGGAGSLRNRFESSTGRISRKLYYPSMTFFERHKIRLVVNALGTSTIVGANVAPPEVIAAAAEALAANCEIDELQRAACRAIAHATGAEA